MSGDDGEGIVFLIASHRNPAQVVRLVRRLRADLPACAVVVHHDATKSALDPASLPRDGVDVIRDATPGAWGEGSLVTITLRGLHRIVALYPSFRWVLLVSGQDYPLRHLGALPAALATMGDGYVDVEPPHLEEPLRYRLTWWRLPRRLQGDVAEAVFERLIYRCNARQTWIRFANGRLGARVGLRLPTPIPRGWTAHQGSNWWTLHRRAIDAFLELERTRPRLFRWFVARTLVPDEGIVQTLLPNVPGLVFRGSDVRYIRWDDRRSGSPATFGIADLDELLASRRFLGRKFDAETDARVLDALDACAARELAEREGAT